MQAEIAVRGGFFIQFCEGTAMFSRLLPRRFVTNPAYTDLLQALGATIIGLASAAGVLFFKQTIRWIYALSFEDLGGYLTSHIGRWGIALVPVLGGVIVGIIRHFWLSEERRHGVSAVMEAVALAGGRIRYQQTPLKALASAISLGMGASVGPEDPSVQIGASVGSFLGQKAHVSDQKTRVFVGAGVAAGIATAFNAPIAGVFFAVEIISGEFFASSFGMMVLSAVMAAVLTRAVVGSMPAFHVPLYAYHGPIELIFYLGLGLVAAPVAVFYIQAIYWAHDFFHELRWPRWLTPVLVGALLGLVGVYFPQILGDSYEAVGDILAGRNLIVSLLLLLVVLKIAFTALSLGAGFIGGVFAPSLFLGAALGGAYGAAMNSIFPGLGLSPSAFALVGMAAVLAGTVRAPVTAIMLLFEMTDDYRIVLPLMFAVTISILISQIFQPESVYTLSLVRDGIRLERGRDVDVLEAIKVREVMEKLPATVSANLSLRTVAAMFDQFHVHGLPVVDDEGRLIGIITLQDVQRAAEKDPANLDKPVGEFCQRHLIVVHPDDSIKEALYQMSAHGIGRLPVVDPVHPDRLIGWINRSSILRAYELGLARRARLRHRGEQVMLEALADAPVLEIVVAEGSPAAGKKVSEVQWPKGAILVRIQRGHKLIIPTGQTVLLPGDRLTVVAEANVVDDLRSLLEVSATEQVERAARGDKEG